MVAGDHDDRVRPGFCKAGTHELVVSLNLAERRIVTGLGEHPREERIVRDADDFNELRHEPPFQPRVLTGPLARTSRAEQLSVSAAAFRKAELESPDAHCSSKRRYAEETAIATLRTLIALAITIAALLSLPHAGAADPQPYEMNVVLSLTGPGTFIGSAEQASLKALEGAVNEQGGIRGQPIRFVFYDDQTNPVIALQLASTIVQKDVPVIFGSSLAASCKAMAPLTKNGPLLYCFSAAVRPDKDSFMYAIIMSGYDSVAAMMRYFRARGLHRIALITTTDASGQASEQDFLDVFHSAEFSDLTLVANEHLSPADLSAAAQISRMSAAAPDAIAIWAPGTPFATVLRAMKDAGLDLPTASTQANMSNTQMRQYDSMLPTSLYFQTEPFMGRVAASPQARKAQALFFDAVKRSNLVPDALMSGSWDPAMIVVDALRHLGTNVSASRLRDYIDGLHGYGGICGIYDFRGSNHRGLTQKDAIIMRWDRTTHNWTIASGLGGGKPVGG